MTKSTTNPKIALEVSFGLAYILGMNKEFKATHVLVDSEGEDNEPVMLVNGCYATEDIWVNGGRWKTDSYLEAIDWSVRSIGGRK